MMKSLHRHIRESGNWERNNWSDRSSDVS